MFWRVVTEDCKLVVKLQMQNSMGIVVIQYISGWLK